MKKCFTLLSSFQFVNAFSRLSVLLTILNPVYSSNYYQT